MTSIDVRDMRIAWRFSIIVDGDYKRVELVHMWTTGATALALVRISDRLQVVDVHHLHVGAP